VITKTVPAARGANRLVLTELRAALPAGRYRVEVRAGGKAVARLPLTVSSH